jgi:DNA invertase Pin-like site-specific DNA recombinase
MSLNPYETKAATVIIGYARTSTVDQEAGLNAQKRDLASAGAQKLFVEQVSSVGSRPQLEAAIDFAREGDTFLVKRVDRLARSMADLMRIVEKLRAKRVELKILDLGIDTTSPQGELMLSLLGGIAQFERRLMLERQREGIAKAKQEGKYKGRAPTARAKADEVKTLVATGMAKTQIAKQLGISRASVHRVLGEAATGN